MLRTFLNIFSFQKFIKTFLFQTRLFPQSITFVYSICNPNTYQYKKPAPPLLRQMIPAFTHIILYISSYFIRYLQIFCKSSSSLATISKCSFSCSFALLYFLVCTCILPLRARERNIQNN